MMRLTTSILLIKLAADPRIRGLKRMRMRVIELSSTAKRCVVVVAACLQHEDDRNVRLALHYFVCDNFCEF